jgi:hypothetical protein
MHTTALESCRIHHNGDYEGEIIITNKDSTSKAIGTICTIKYITQELVGLQRRLEFSYHDQIRPLNGQVTLKGIDPEYGKEITVLQKDVETFLAIRLVSKIVEKVEQASYESLGKIAQELEIKE